MKERILRVNEVFRRELSEVIERSYADPQLAMMTITEVRISKDLRYAKAYVSLFGEPKQRERALKMLEKMTPQIQMEMGARVRLRYTPSLRFILDETEDKSERVLSIINQIKKSKDLKSS